MPTLNELKQQRAAAVDALLGLTADKTAYDGKKTEIEGLDAQITRAEEAATIAARAARPSDGQIRVASPFGRTAVAAASPDEKVVGSYARTVAARAKADWTDEDWLGCTRQVMGFTIGEGHFDTLFAQMRAVAQVKLDGVVDPRLARSIGDADRFERAPAGASEMDAAAGGFLVQTDFATAIFARAYAMGEILRRTQKFSLSTAASGIKIPAVDETSRANGSRWGGVASYWVAEGNTATASKPKFRLVELDLKKLMSIWYVTDELMNDASVFNTIANQAFAEELQFMAEAAMVGGPGAGAPLGVLNAPCKVRVTKESGQSAATLVYENVLAMWSRMWGRSRPNAVWFINQDVEPQLFAMKQVIGTAGVPVYLPANGISGLPYGTLFGRPVIPLEYCETLGTEGDIILADYSQYAQVDKGGVQAASSMHVNFTTDEMAFRTVYRLDGRPLWHAPLTPYKGSATKSPFITLETRS